MSTHSNLKNLPHRDFIVSSPDGGEIPYLEEYCLRILEIKPRARLKQALKEKKILLNGKPALRTARLMNGDRLEILDFQDSGLFIGTENQPLIKPNPKILVPELLVTRDFLVFNKAAGLNTHPNKAWEQDSTLNGILASHPECMFSGAKPLEGGLVHRLDRGTSGALLCTRNISALHRFQELWKSHQVNKIYLAWVQGDLRKMPSGELSYFLAHDPKSKKKMKVFLKKPSGMTSWKATTSFILLESAPQASLVMIQIQEGVTHQIRASFAAAGHPVLGDPIYSALLERKLFPILSRKSKSQVLDSMAREFLRSHRSIKTVPSLNRLPSNAFYLHSYTLSSNEVRELRKPVVAPVPDYFGF